MKIKIKNSMKKQVMEMAHQKNMTINQFIIFVLCNKLNQKCTNTFPSS